MTIESTSPLGGKMPRRTFIGRAGAGAAGLGLAPAVFADVPVAKNDEINVALIGCGSQGRVLMNAMLKIPGIKFVAVCDIWDYSQRYGSRYLSRFDHDVEVYEDYRVMLEKQKNIDACVIATPDFMHAPISVACLEAGKAVYCEKMMSNTIEAAKTMVQAQNRTKGILQIGHQRRSNPRYRHALGLAHEQKMFGRLTHAYAQWNRGKTEALGWPSKYTMSDEMLKKYGYNSMEEFRNWRWFKRYGGGPISDLGAHQIDIFNWVFGGTPTSVIASGGTDFYPEFEMEDNVMAIYEYQTAEGVARAYYQVLTTTSSLGFHERFMGIEGTLSISENPTWNHAYREAATEEAKWLAWGKEGLIKKEGAEYEDGKEQVIVDVRESPQPDKWDLPVVLDKPIHQPHLENFFATVRGEATLNCPAIEGYKTCVTVKKIKEALHSGCKYTFKPEDFAV